MTGPSELQQLWQQDNSAETDQTKENHMIWMELIQEKRRGFDALLRAERRGEYAITLVFVPLLAVMAWKAKFPVTQIGYAVLAATLVSLAISLWRTGQDHREALDRTLRAHLQALLDRYDRYLRFLANARIWNAAGLVLGYLAVVFGVPVSRLNGTGRVLACVVLAALCVALWSTYRRSAACILARRNEAARLLASLPDTEIVHQA
jgi:hypothetical protein